MKWDETTSQFKPLTMTWVETGVYPHIQWFIITWQWQLFYPVYPTSGFPLSICGWHRSFSKSILWEYPLGNVNIYSYWKWPSRNSEFFHEKCMVIFQFAMWQLPLEYLHSRWFPQSISNTLNKWWARWLNKWPQHHGLGLQRDLPDHALILGPGWLVMFWGETWSFWIDVWSIYERCMVY